MDTLGKLNKLNKAYAREIQAIQYDAHLKIEGFEKAIARIEDQRLKKLKLARNDFQAAYDEITASIDGDLPQAYELYHIDEYEGIYPSLDAAKQYIKDEYGDFGEWEGSGEFYSFRINGAYLADIRYAFRFENK